MDNKPSELSPCCHAASSAQAPAETLSAKTLRFWQDTGVWRRSAYNTMWCLIGCSIGDFGTIAFFQFFGIALPTMTVMMLATMNGLITSVILETVILKRGGFGWSAALKTALGMSFISMLAMEISMNAVDWFLVGGAKLVLWVMPIMLIAGFVTPWPYNYWRLKKFNKSCH